MLINSAFAIQYCYLYSVYTRQNNRAMPFRVGLVCAIRKQVLTLTIDNTVQVDRQLHGILRDILIHSLQRSWSSSRIVIKRFLLRMEAG